jgi:hypothetical protein
MVISEYLEQTILQSYILSKVNQNIQGCYSMLQILQSRNTLRNEDREECQTVKRAH